MAARPLQVHGLWFEKVHVENTVNDDSQQNEQEPAEGWLRFPQERQASAGMSIRSHERQNAKAEGLI